MIRYKKNKKYVYRRRAFLLITLIIISTLFFLKCRNTESTEIEHNISSNISFNEKIYKYISNPSNRDIDFSKAKELNGGSSANTCIYFLSEILRKNGLDINDSTCNTNQLVSILNKDGWTRNSDLSTLKPGDICFTTNDATGNPSHAYIFMSWKTDKNYDEAYIVDNQAKDYGNELYHLRNIKFTSCVNGETKDAFSFYMRK